VGYAGTSTLGVLILALAYGRHVDQARGSDSGPALTLRVLKEARRLRFGFWTWAWGSAAEAVTRPAG